MKRVFLLVFTALAALVATSCQKEEMGRVLTATIEQYEHNSKDGNGASKAYINDEYYACWENNDKVNINGNEYSISISEGDEHNYSASIQGTEGLEGDLFAYYPASQVTNLTATGGTVTLPQVQTYRESNGHQIIDNPMAAYCPANSNTLRFRNLCALLKVTIQAPNNEDLAVKTIIVKGNENQMLWGSAPLILDYQNKPMLDEMSNGSAYVGLSFGNDPATISANSTKSFYIVVPAASAFTNLTIHVITDPNKVYQKESRVGQALLRNQIGAFTYAPSCADTNNASSILYTGSIDGFHSDVFGGAQVIFNAGGVLLFDRHFTTIGNGAFDGCSSLSSITLPASLNSIGDYAFEFCSSLSSITLPTGVTSIGSYAFEFCSSLSIITLPASLTSIGDGAFYGCSSLSSITLPTGVTSIGDNAFEFCSSLSSITLPASLTSIGDYAFYECSSLKTVYVNRGGNGQNITQGGSSMFYNCPLNEDGIYVPAEAVDTYKGDPNWSTYAERIKAQGSK